jgi:hypothetical protein
MRRRTQSGSIVAAARWKHNGGKKAALKAVKMAVAWGSASDFSAQLNLRGSGTHQYLLYTRGFPLARTTQGGAAELLARQLLG